MPVTDYTNVAGYQQGQTFRFDTSQNLYIVELFCFFLFNPDWTNVLSIELTCPLSIASIVPGNLDCTFLIKSTSGAVLSANWSITEHNLPNLCKY